MSKIERRTAEIAEVVNQIEMLQEKQEGWPELDCGEGLKIRFEGGAQGARLAFGQTYLCDLQTARKIRDFLNEWLDD